MAGPTLNLVVLRTADVDRLRAFYARVGLDLREERHGTGPPHFAADCGGGAVFEVYPATADRPAEASTRVGFRVADVGAAVAALRSAGARVVAEPKPSPWGVRAVVADPDGRAVELTEAAGPRD